MPSRFAYIWQYTIKPSEKVRFLEAYAPGGEWDRLFGRDLAYLKTTLIQDCDDENRYVTIDYWKSREDRDSFRDRYSGEFEELDRQCESYTEYEVFLGDFIEVVDIAA